MNRNDFKSMSTDELWALHEEIASMLAASLLAEKRVLENRLKQLKGGAEAESSPTGRRPYPTVVPKFRNPDRPSETWAGRGKQPRWLTAQLRSGKKLDDFRIKSPLPGSSASAHELNGMANAMASSLNHHRTYSQSLSVT